MPKNESDAKALSKRGQKALAKQGRRFSIADVEKKLLKAFPRKDAEDWDVMGLTVGESALEVTRVAVALDSTVEAVRQAAAAGANVLVTHHPPYMSGPESFSPADSPAQNPGAVVWAAIQYRVALMNFHTALDVSSAAQSVLPKMLGLSYKGELVESIPSSKKKGYGQICKAPSGKEGPFTLSRLAAKCVSVFGRAPRVWGDMDRSVKKVVCALGSAGNVAHGALAADADVLVCGEVKYHDALELSQAGLAIIELGHDVSELPLTAVLAKALVDIGLPAEKIAMIDQSRNWTTPEAIRL